MHSELVALNARIHDLAQRRQRLWQNEHRLTGERIVAITRELNGHASDILRGEQSRFLRGRGGLWGLKRQLLADQERDAA